MAGMFDWLFPSQTQGDASVPVSGDAGQAAAGGSGWGSQISDALAQNRQSMIGFGLGLMSGDSKGDAYRNALLGAQRGVVLDAASAKTKKEDEEKRKRQQALLMAFNGNADLKPYMGAAIANPDFGESLLKAQAANALSPADYTYQQGADGIYAINRKDPKDIKKLDIPAGKPDWNPVEVTNPDGTKQTVFQRGGTFARPDQLGIGAAPQQGGLSPEARKAVETGKGKRANDIIGAGQEADIFAQQAQQAQDFVKSSVPDSAIGPFAGSGLNRSVDAMAGHQNEKARQVMDTQMQDLALQYRKSVYHGTGQVSDAETALAQKVLGSPSSYDKGTVLASLEHLKQRAAYTQQFSQYYQQRGGDPDQAWQEFSKQNPLPKSPLADIAGLPKVSGGKGNTTSQGVKWSIEGN